MRLKLKHALGGMNNRGAKAAGVGALSLACVVAGTLGSGVASAGASTNPVVIEVDSSVNTPQNSQPGVWQAVQAYAGYINAKGGINGKKLVVKLCDDQNDPNQATLCARKTVSDKAVALVGSTTLFSSVIDPIVQAAGIPVITGYANNADWTNPDVYAVGGGSLIEFSSLGQFAASKGVKKANGLTINVPDGIASVQMYKYTFGKLGGSVGQTVISPLTTQDFTPYLTQATSNGVNSVVLVQPAVPQNLNIVQVKKQLGSSAQLMGVTADVNNSLLLQAGGAANGLMVTGTYPLLSSPVWNTYKSALNKYAPNKTLALATINSDYEEAAWASAVAFENVASKISGPVTAATMSAALKKATNVTTGGLTPTMNFTKPWSVPGAPRIFNHDAYYSTVKGSSLVSVDKNKPHPVPANLVNPVNPSS
jgi:ABC-type branched-subunit amino acid transport system substrate-binding protein